MSKDNFTDKESIKKQKREEKKTQDDLAKFDYDKLMGELKTEKIKKRSIGVTIFGWLYRISGALGIFASGTMIGMMFLLDTTKEMLRTRAESFPIPMNLWILGSFTIAFSIAISIFFLMIGNGLLRLERRARKCVIYLSIFGLIYGLLKFSTKGSGLEALIMSAITFYFFTRHKVKQQFTRAKPSLSD